MKVDHKTFIGGFVSLIIKISLIAYVTNKFKTMFLFEADNVSVNTIALDMNKYDPINISDTETLIFWDIRKTKDGEKNLFLDSFMNKDKILKDWKRYIRIEFVKQSLTYEYVNGVVNVTNKAKIYGVK
jgi:hypothetical protein